MGVIFTVCDDTNDLLVPFIQKHNKLISRENIIEIYLRASLGQITSGQFWQEVGLGAQYPQIEIVYLDTQLILDDGFIPVARAMSKQYSLALLSNDVSEWSIYLRKRFGLDFLDMAIISGDIHCRKPDLDIYERFLKETGAQAGECIFIDDRCMNLAVARSVGMRTIHFLRQEESDFEADACIAHFNELEHALEKICKQIHRTANRRC